VQRHFAAILSLSLAACAREEVTHFRVQKAAGATFASAAPHEDVTPPPAPEGALQWTLPKGWTQTMTGGMRYATIKPAVPGSIDVSVVVLPGPAGGELANVNRWRGQLGLAAVDAAALASMRKDVHSKAGTFALYDFSSEGPKPSRMIAALAQRDGNSWFIKMLGDASSVAAARGDFIHLLQGMHP